MSKIYTSETDFAFKEAKLLRSKNSELTGSELNLLTKKYIFANMGNLTTPPYGL